MGAFGGYTYYKKKKAPTWTLSSSNPEYIDTVGPSNDFVNLIRSE